MHVLEYRNTKKPLLKLGAE